MCILEGPEDDSVRIETCCPSTIINIIKFFFVFDSNSHLSNTSVDCLLAAVWHMPVAVCAVLISWWWTERPSETCRVFFKDKINSDIVASWWNYYRNILRCTDLWTSKQVARIIKHRSTQNQKKNWRHSCLVINGASSLQSFLPRMGYLGCNSVAHFKVCSILRNNPWSHSSISSPTDHSCPFQYYLKYIAPPEEQCHNSKFVIFQEKLLKVLKCYNFLWVQRRHNCSPAASFANCVMTLYLLTYSMMQSPSWETNWFAASKEIPRISRNPKVHYRTQKRPPSWASPIQSIYPHPTSWRSILILSTHLRLGLPSGLLPSGFPTKTLYTPSPHPYAPHAQPISFFSILSPAQYWVRSTNHLAHLYQ